MGGYAQFFELLENSSWNLNFFLKTIDQNGYWMQVILETSSGTVFGMRNIVAKTGNFRIVVQIDFHNRGLFYHKTKKCGEWDLKK